MFKFAVGPSHVEIWRRVHHLYKGSLNEKQKLTNKRGWVNERSWMIFHWLLSSEPSLVYLSISFFNFCLLLISFFFQIIAIKITCWLLLWLAFVQTGFSYQRNFSWLNRSVLFEYLLLLSQQATRVSFEFATLKYQHAHFF